MYSVCYDNIFNHNLVNIFIIPTGIGNVMQIQESFNCFFCKQIVCKNQGTLKMQKTMNPVIFSNVKNSTI